MDNATLPEFSAPPITETVLAVGLAGQCGDLDSMLSFWTTVKNELPRVSDHPAYQQVIERFDRPVRGVELDLSGLGRTKSRLWLTSDDRTRVLQLQEDWLAYNWRKQAGVNSDYPRFSSTRLSFEQYVDSYLVSVSEGGWADVLPTQCEVTYVNTIAPCEVWSRHIEAEKVFTFLAPLGLSSENLAAESVNYYMTATVVSDDRPIGRLHVTLSSAMSEDGEPRFILNLTVRGEPYGSRDRNGVMAFFDIGRTAIVRSFTDLTTDAMHQVWGRVR